MPDFIYKYPLPTSAGPFTLTLPSKAQVLTVTAALHNRPVLYARVDDSEDDFVPMEVHECVAIGTGQPFPTWLNKEKLNYLGTAVCKRYPPTWVWHYFQIIKPSPCKEERRK